MRVTHSNTFMNNHKAKQVIEELFHWLLSRYKIVLEIC